jgi:polysaccharide export outer membrane protein
MLVANLVGTGCSPGPHLEHDAVGVESIRDHEARKHPRTELEGFAFLKSGEPRPAYRIGPLDRVSVVVVGRPDLGSQGVRIGEGENPVTTIMEDGTCYLPRLGRFEVNGFTAENLRIVVRDLYGDVSSKITDPEVVVDIISTRSSGVFMDGEVGKPGMAYFNDAHLTLGEMVSAAGGLTPSADPRNATLIRGGKKYPLDYRGAQEGRNNLDALILENGDHVYFPSIQDQKVYVFGEVIQQGEFAIPAKGLTMLEALAMAKGPDPVRAKTSSLYLLRPENTDTTVYQLKFGELLESSDVMLQSGDRVYVPTTPLTNFARTFSQLLPFITFATTVFLITYGIQTNE